MKQHNRFGISLRTSEALLRRYRAGVTLLILAFLLPASFAGASEANFPGGSRVNLMTVESKVAEDVCDAVRANFTVVVDTTTNALAASHVTGTAATMNGLIIPGGKSLTVEFHYGTTSGVYTNKVDASPNSVSGSGSDSVSAAVSGLAPGTTYYYKILAYTGSPADTFVSGEEGFKTISTAAGNALKVDGSNDYVTVPYHAALNPAGDFTVELWARADIGTGEHQSPLTSRGSFTGYTFYETPSSDAHWQFWFGRNDFNWVTIIGDTVLLGTWTHLAAVYQGTTFIFYVNGDSAGADNSGLAVNFDAPFYLGCGDNAGTPWFYFNGAIAEVRVWNIARSRTDIQSTMHTTLAGTEAGLVAYWQLNESGTDSTAYECIGGYNGTLTNFAFSGDGWVPATNLSLPVQATEFSAKTAVGSVTLSWSTMSEVNSAGFIVLRQQCSDVGLPISDWEILASYKTIGTLRGLGTSSSGRVYRFVDQQVKSGATYNYRIQSVSTDGTTKDLMMLSNVTVDVPKSYALYQNYPNPFNPTTTMRFDLKQQSTVTLEIYNVLGQRVSVRDYGTMDAGRYNELVDMGRVASGVYYYRIVARGANGENFTAIKKLLLMK